MEDLVLTDTAPLKPDDSGPIQIGETDTGEPTMTVSEWARLLKLADGDTGLTRFEAPNGVFVGRNLGISDSGEGVQVEIFGRLVNDDGSFVEPERP